MYRSLLLSALLALGLVAASCGEPVDPIPPAPDAGAVADAGISLDAGELPADAGEQPADAGAEDAGEPADAGQAPEVPLSGFGAISGTCGVLDDELTSDTFHLVRNHLDFAADPFDDVDEPLLTEGGQTIHGTENAGGSSVDSEVFAFEMLARCELATLLATETEVVYDPPTSKKTDILVSIDGLRIGVSVLRAADFPYNPYSLANATTKLTDKLNGIAASTANVVPEQKWVKQILHVLADSDQNADLATQAWDALDAGLKGDTILVLTVTDGDDAFLY